MRILRSHAALVAVERNYRSRGYRPKGHFPDESHHSQALRRLSMPDERNPHHSDTLGVACDRGRYDCARRIFGWQSNGDMGDNWLFQIFSRIKTFQLKIGILTVG